MYRFETPVIALSIVLLFCPPLQAGKYNAVLDIGDPAPVWKDLPGVDGKTHSLSDVKDKDFVVVVFHSCSCDVAEEYENRIKAYTRKYGGKDGRVAVVAINVSKDEEDRLPAMKKRAKEHAFNFLYLFDESQQTARKFGALWTPEFFILNRERQVVYMGGMDDRSAIRFVKHRYLEDATTALLAGQRPEVQETPAIGCRIKLERKRRKK
jgi:peroxiredoxin